MGIDVAGASDGELRTVAAAIDREHRRREGLAADVRAAQFQQEMSEVDAGSRLPYDEHLNAATPEQVTAWMAAGKLTHLGYGKSKVRGTR